MLTESEIKAAKHGKDAYKLTDMRGLYLEVSKLNPQGYGSKLWRFRYKLLGVENRIALGAYPDVSLDKARDLLAAERTRLAAGVDPAAKKREARENLKGTLRELAEEWMTGHFGKWEKNGAQRVRVAASERYVKKIRGRMQNYILPEIGSRPITTITSADVLKVLRKMEAAGKGDSVLKAKNETGQVFNYAISTGRFKGLTNPISALKDSLRDYVKGEYAGLTEPRAVGQLLRDIDAYGGRIETRYLMKLMAYLWQRPSELRMAEWTEFDMKDARWTIPPERMKVKNRPAHIVPLPRQAIAILKDLHAYTGDQPFVFPGIGARDQPLSEGTVNEALRHMGYDTKTEHTGHGFRTTASTLIAEEDYKLIDVKEANLAHGKGKTRAAYERGQLFKQRRTLLQKYADYLDKLRTLPVASHGRSAMTAAMKSSMSDSSHRMA
jgi:integrase